MIALVLDIHSQAAYLQELFLLPWLVLSRQRKVYSLFGSLLAFWAAVLYLARCGLPVFLTRMLLELPMPLQVALGTLEGGSHIF